MPISGYSEFLPVFLHQKGLNQFKMPIFGHSEFIPVFLGQNVRKNSEWPFLAIPNLYQSFWKNFWKKFRMAIFVHFWIFTVKFKQNRLSLYISLQYSEKFFEKENCQKKTFLSKKKKFF